MALIGGGFWNQAQQAARAPQGGSFGTTRPGRKPAVNPALTGYGPNNDPALRQQAPPPPETNYDALFRASIDTQRANIDSQLKAAMGSLAQREQMANAIVARQPAETERNYASVAPDLQALNDKAAAQTKADHAMTLKSASDNAADIAPILAAAGTDKASRLSDQPYLQAGTSELYQRQRGALDQAALEAKAGIEGQMSDYLQQNALQAAQQKQQEDSFYAHTLFQHRLDQQDREAQMKADQEAQRRDALGKEPPRGSKDWWAWNQQVNTGKARQFQNSHLVDYVRQQVEHGLVGPDARTHPASLNSLLRKYSGPQYAALRSWLQANAGSLIQGKSRKVHGMREGSGSSGGRSVEVRGSGANRMYRVGGTWYSPETARRMGLTG